MYVYVIIHQPSYWVNENSLFMLYFSIACGAMLTIDIFLVCNLLKKKHFFTTMWLLLIYSAVQTFTIFIDIPCNILYGGQWNTGYIYIIFELITVVIYLGRFFTEKTEKEYMLRHNGRKEGHCEF